jgi:hypothetical protein
MLMNNCVASYGAPHTQHSFEREMLWDCVRHFAPQPLRFYWSAVCRLPTLTAIPHHRVWRRTRPVWRHGKTGDCPSLKEKGYKVVVREFSDYVQPNMALSNGSIDANLFQHSLYFDKFTADKGLKLTNC